MDSRAQTDRFRKKFRRSLLAFLRGSPEHPLGFLLNASGNFHRWRPGALLDEAGFNLLYVFEAGHRVSARRARDLDQEEEEEAEELGVQSRFFNQYDSATVESKGAGFSVESTFYNVEGVPVEFRTLREYRKAGLIEENVFNAAIEAGPTSGWTFD